MMSAKGTFTYPVLQSIDLRFDSANARVHPNKSVLSNPRFVSVSYESVRTEPDSADSLEMKRVIINFNIKTKLRHNSSRGASSAPLSTLIELKILS